MGLQPKHTYTRPGAAVVTSFLYSICNFDFVVVIVIVQMWLAFKKGLSRSLQERSLDIGRALKSVTLVQSSLKDCRANVEQFNRQCFERSIKIFEPEVNHCTFSRLYAKWNENKVYRPTHKNLFGATVGSIYYWKYCSVAEPPHQKELWILPWWSYCSWIYNYLCNQCLSPLKLWFRIHLTPRCT